MNILGISFLSDASAALIVDGELVAAISEERLNRIKQWNGIPRAAIDAVLSMAGLGMEDIDWIATHGACPGQPEQAAYDRTRAAIQASDLPEDLKQRQLDGLQSRYDHETGVITQRTPEYLDSIRALGRPVLVYGHHQAHAATAFFGSGYEDCVAFTADGWGEDGSSTLWKCGGDRMELLTRSASIDSLGYFYGSLTKALGFIPHRHEGKVLGLAAYCPAPRSLPEISRMIRFDPERNAFANGMEHGLYLPRFENERLSRFVKDFKREDISAAAQQTLEAVAVQAVAALGDKARRVALAGGIFANVKLNQRIAELPNVDEVYVFPNMGDGGLSVGAAYLAWREKTGTRPRPMTTALLGPEASAGEIETALRNGSQKYVRSADIGADVARLLAQGNIVARFSGRMEYGPRALCNRSILYKASEPEVNRWLNDRLMRSEFMPFAPATLEEHAAACYKGIEAAPVSSRYMTITFDCTDQMKAQAPAAVHVDGTARPQVISKADYPDFHRILGMYQEQTGLPTVINTSFNMHEEPIVCTPSDAVRAFVAARLPYLAIGDFLAAGEDAALP